MKLTQNLLIAAAMTGALAATPITTFAGDHQKGTSGASTEKQGCNGKSNQMGMDKNSCKGKSQQGAEGEKSMDKEKSACSGKDGCGAKNGDKNKGA